MDIIGAMEKEREYLSFRMKGEEPFHLIDAVKEYGFESLNEYFEAKRNYEFSQLEFEVYEAPTNTAVDTVLSIITENKTAILFVTTNETLVWNGNNGECNVDYCKECGIPVYPLHTGGGTIVSTLGDINIGLCMPVEKSIQTNDILNKFADVFKRYTTKSVVVNGNDILINGYKVLGSSVYNKNKMFMFVASVSMADKTDLICKICYKHSVKQPGYIDFMTAEQLKGEITQWLKRQ